MIKRSLLFCMVGILALTLVGCSGSVSSDNKSVSKEVEDEMHTNKDITEETTSDEVITEETSATVEYSTFTLTSSGEGMRTGLEYQMYLSGEFDDNTGVCYWGKYQLSFKFPSDIFSIMSNADSYLSGNLDTSIVNAEDCLVKCDVFPSYDSLKAYLESDTNYSFDTNYYGDSPEKYAYDAATNYTYPAIVDDVSIRNYTGIWTCDTSKYINHAHRVCVYAGYRENIQYNVEKCTVNGKSAYRVSAETPYNAVAFTSDNKEILKDQVKDTFYTYGYVVCDGDFWYLLSGFLIDEAQPEEKKVSLKSYIDNMIETVEFKETEKYRYVSDYSIDDSWTEVYNSDTGEWIVSQGGEENVEGAAYRDICTYDELGRLNSSYTEEYHTKSSTWERKNTYKNSERIGVRREIRYCDANGNVIKAYTEDYDAITDTWINQKELEFDAEDKETAGEQETTTYEEENAMEENTAETKYENEEKPAYTFENGVLTLYDDRGIEACKSAEKDIYNCRELVIKDGVTAIGNETFSNFKSLRSVTMADSVITIGDRAFENCSSLTIVDFSKNLVSIGRGAFQNCKNLTNVSLYEGLVEIESEAFASCSRLKTVSLPDSIMEIGNVAFAYCPMLLEINIPSNILTIGDLTFAGCSSLTGITIPDGVTGIYAAFINCTSLSKIIIPPSVTEICEAFSGSGLSIIYGETGSYAEQYANEMGYTFIAQ